MCENSPRRLRAKRVRTKRAVSEWDQHGREKSGMRISLHEALCRNQILESAPLFWEFDYEWLHFARPIWSRVPRRSENRLAWQVQPELSWLPERVQWHVASWCQLAGAPWSNQDKKALCLCWQTQQLNGNEQQRTVCRQVMNERCSGMWFCPERRFVNCCCASPALHTFYSCMKKRKKIQCKILFSNVLCWANVPYIVSRIRTFCIS